MDRIIENVPRVAQFLDGGSMLTPFIGSLCAALCAMGRPRPYADILAMSGAGNRLAWRPGTWDGGNVDILSCEEEPFAPHARALKALGLSGTYRLAKPIAGLGGPFVAEDEARAEIVKSLDAGIPVIAMGIIGPPECCVVFGYEDSGEKLIGWNYFQTSVNLPEDKPFVKAGWFGGLVGYILLSEGGPAPSERENALAAARAIVGNASRPDVRGSKIGLAAWEAMLDALENASFDDCIRVPLVEPGGAWDDDVWDKTVQGRFYTYCDALCEIHERGVALPYWEKVRAENPDWAEPIAEAMDAWRACAAYGGFLWNHLTMDEAGYRKFADPGVRKILAEEGHRAMELDRKAVEAIGKILA
jgi:hypothetical protein